MWSSLGVAWCWNMEWYKVLFIQGAAEIVKHFKILVTCFSARVSRSAGIWTFRFSQHGALVSKGTCVWCGTVWTGSITETQRGFCRERNQQEAPSPNAIRRWVRQWCEEGSVTCERPPGRPSSVCTPDIIARVLVSVSRGPRRSACKHAQALRKSAGIHPLTVDQNTLLVWDQ